MLKIIYYATAFSSLLLFTGCCSKGMQAFSDGNYYNANWCQYDTCRVQGDGTADCYKEDGEYITTLYKMHPNQVSDYRYRQQKSREDTRDFNQAMQNFSKSLQDATPKTTYNYHYLY